MTVGAASVAAASSDRCRGEQQEELQDPSSSRLLLALLKYTFYPLFILDNGMNLISKSLTVLTPV